MKTILLFLAIIIGGKVLSQNYEFDLSKKDTKSETVDPNSRIILTIKNKVVTEGYHVNVIRRNKPVEPLSFPADVDPGIAKFGGVCPQLTQLMDDLRTTKQEDKIPAAASALDAMIKTIEGDKVTFAACLPMLPEAKQLLLSIFEEILDTKIKAGEEIEIQISRSVGGTMQTWTYIFSTLPKSYWQMTYGFNFIPHLFSKENLYFARPQNGQYIITRESNRRVFSYSPTVCFTRYPTRPKYQDFFVSYSAGLGYDFQNPVVFGSLTFVLGQNWLIHAGIIWHRQNFLLGKYSPGDLITEELSREQLHEQHYTLNPFFAFSYRFREPLSNRVNGPH